MVQMNLLKARMVERDISVEDLAKALNLNKSTLYRRFRAPEELSVKETAEIARVLDLDGDDALKIFYPKMSHIRDNCGEGGDHTT